GFGNFGGGNFGGGNFGGFNQGGGGLNPGSTFIVPGAGPGPGMLAPGGPGGGPGGGFPGGAGRGVRPRPAGGGVGPRSSLDRGPDFFVSRVTDDPSVRVLYDPSEEQEEPVNLNNGPRRTAYSVNPLQLQLTSAAQPDDSDKVTMTDG